MDHCTMLTFTMADVFLGFLAAVQDRFEKKKKFAIRILSELSDHPSYMGTSCAKFTVPQKLRTIFQ